MVQPLAAFKLFVKSYLLMLPVGAEWWDWNVEYVRSPSPGLYCTWSMYIAVFSLTSSLLFTSGQSDLQSLFTSVQSDLKPSVPQCSVLPSAFCSPMFSLTPGLLYTVFSLTPSLLYTSVHSDPQPPVHISVQSDLQPSVHQCSVGPLSPNPSFLYTSVLVWPPAFCTHNIQLDTQPCVQTNVQSDLPDFCAHH